jgi:hypothetical protein
VVAKVGDFCITGALHRPAVGRAPAELLSDARDSIAVAGDGVRRENIVAPGRTFDPSIGSSTSNVTVAVRSPAAAAGVSFRA